MNKLPLPLPYQQADFGQVTPANIYFIFIEKLLKMFGYNYLLFVIDQI